MLKKIINGIKSSFATVGSKRQLYEANKELRKYPMFYSKRTIVNVNLVPAMQAGWFMTIVYSVEI